MNKVIGIDLGTTYSAVAYCDEHGVAKIIPNSNGSRITPSVVFFESSQSILVGEDAKDETELYPDKVVAYVKREMGKNKSDVRKEENYGNPKPYSFYDKTYSPEEISSIILQKLKEDASLYLKSEISDAIITVPAYFNDFERNATIKAGQLAGLNVLQVLNEPTAAAISYGVTTNNTNNQKVFVFDLGGGTFDVTILELRQGELKIIATDGDHRLGGKDWDFKLIEYVSNEFINKFGEDPRDKPDSLADLTIRTEKAKKQLSDRTETSVIVRTDTNSLKVDISRENLEEITSDLMNRIEGLCDLVLNDAKLTWGDINTIVLAGGSTRMPMVQRLLKQLSKKEIRTDLVNPDECVALGAAIQGQLIKGEQTNGRIGSSGKQFLGISKITDVASHSLGFVTLKNNKLHNSILIPKNNSIPFEIKKADFTTSFDNQSSLEVLILQGESKNPFNCTLLNGLEFYNIPPSEKGKAKIEITFKYNTNGVVEVEASCNSIKLPFNRIENPSLPVIEDVQVDPLSVIIAIDLSGSMADNPLREAKKAAKKFVHELNHPNVKIALMPFADTVSVNQGFTKEKNLLNKGIDDWVIGMVGGANDAEPFRDCLDMLSFENGQRLIIVLTDGRWYCKERAVENATKCANAGIETTAIGFGSADIDFLKTIATSSDYHFVNNVNQLEQTFLNIATELSSNKIK